MEESISPIVTFAAGAGSALAAQWMANALTRRRERVKEYWIRRLNSYQDAYHWASYLTTLLQMGSAPPEHLWAAYGHLSKSVDDAFFFSPEEERALAQLQEVMEQLSAALEDRSHVPLKRIRESLDRLRFTFYDSEKLLMKERARWRRTVKPRP